MTFPPQYESNAKILKLSGNTLQLQQICKASKTEQLKLLNFGINLPHVYPTS